MASNVPIACGPRGRDRRFCERWLEHFDPVRAYREAGFKGTDGSIHTRAKAKLKRWAEHLQPLWEAKASVVAERLVISQETVLDAMAAVAFPKIEQYLVQVRAMRTLKNSDGSEKLEPASDAEGKPVFVTALKPLHELTPQQLLTVEIYTDTGGHPHYKLPTPKVRHQYLESLGKQMGMFMDKLILQNHEHTHQHAHLHLQGVPTQQLEGAVKALLPVVGPEFARQLGFTPEEYQEAERAEKDED